MIFRNLIFEPEVVKQRLRAGMVSHHEQQASKWNGEQQHRVLWPAYNLNIAPPQASTEGLFQQTQAFSLTTLSRAKWGFSPPKPATEHAVTSSEPQEREQSTRSWDALRRSPSTS